MKTKLELKVHNNMCDCSVCSYAREIFAIASKLSEEDRLVIEDLYERYDYTSSDLGWLKYKNKQLLDELEQLGIEVTYMGCGVKLANKGES